ncbi:formylglycine-generating enzyme family protein [Nonomuraea zeae]|uniref:Formylglycine-generating enzyme family protein n=1 Tax=Nonomuraea zeae TaxID=1642303 RepID=A0A5S4H1M2_9ACTN|nr:SUMF1/EgtB/PvdO family nonheme iron enzyme [Nonomuraea zeae]TMR38594.1 formylglycine-generating enzyme family protein [Nonomuraea zeae]
MSRAARSTSSSMRSISASLIRLPARPTLGDHPRGPGLVARRPTRNTLDDGYLTTAPVRTYRPNGYGLWQVLGNVWEWCADWSDPGYYDRSPSGNPRGPAAGAARVLRGGSYLCHDSCCNRYRVAARSANTPDSAMGNAGFRTAGDTVGDTAGDMAAAAR